MRFTNRTVNFIRKHQKEAASVLTVILCAVCCLLVVAEPAYASAVREIKNKFGILYNIMMTIAQGIGTIVGAFGVSNVINTNSTGFNNILNIMTM